MSSTQPKDIAVDMAQGGHFVEEETEAILDAIDLASDQNGTTYLTVGGKRVAAIVPVDVAEYESTRLAGELAPADRTMAGEYVSRVTYNGGQRMQALALQVTEDSYQRVIAWMQLAGQHATWSDDNGHQRLNWGGKHGSYSIPSGWWVVYVADADFGIEAGFDGWSDADFENRWIEKSEQARQDRLAAVTYGSMRRRP